MLNIEIMDDVPVSVKVDSPRFFDRFRIFLRQSGYSYATEKTYIHWCLRFVRFHKKKHPEEMHTEEVTEFLNHLSVVTHCSAGTQRIALNALVCMYDKFMKKPLGKLEYRFATTPKRLPVVLSRSEAQQIISLTSGDYTLMYQLMYGSGLRQAECLSLRIKDIDFAHNLITVRQGKGNKDRSTLLPRSLVEALKERIERTRVVHEEDLRDGFGSVYMPDALARKLKGAEYEFKWQFLFPSGSISKDPRSEIRRRHHIHPRQVGKHLKKAVMESGIHKRVTCHTFRHSFATELAKSGVHLQKIQKLLGHVDIGTTEIYLHIAEEMGLKVVSPLDT